ncbi:MAG: plasmid replication initiator RepB (plasmid) [Methyloprofundus sp.]|nr:MAG: plasmid replication initiator RepB [Methyloprofundus sp.]
MKKIKKKPALSSLIVTQANELVESRYNLSLGEQRLIFTMIARIQPDDEDFKPYSISISQLAEFLGINNNHMYADCKKMTKKLLGKVVEIQEENRLLQTHWVSSADYIDGTGVVKLTFDPLLKPYLLQLKGSFTSSKLEMLLCFKSQYTMRMYMLLKQYERLQVREIELLELRQILGIRVEQYEKYANFKKNILQTTQKELEAKADLYFEFEEVKYGRGVGAIIFYIHRKTVPEKVKRIPKTTATSTQSKVTELEQLLSLVLTEHQPKKTVISGIQLFLKKEDFVYVKRNILYSNHKADKSYAGFLNKALKEDWGHDWELDQQQAIKNKPKEIWERQGFSSESEYDQFMYEQQMASLGKT